MAKATSMLYKLVSSAGTGYFYVGSKNMKLFIYFNHQEID